MNHYEQKIIGGIISGVVRASEVDLEASDFSDDQLGAAFAVTRGIETDNLKIDASILAARIGESDSCFYSAKDFDLMAKSAQSAAVAFDAIDKVKATALKAFLIESASSIALAQTSTGAEILDRLKRLVDSADKFYKTSENNFVFMSDIAPKVEALYRDLNNGVSYTVPTYFPRIDELILDGFSKGDLHVIAGFTGQGKSAIALNFAVNQARNNKLVGFVSREMSATENTTRLLSADSETERWKIRTGLSDYNLQKLSAHLAKFKDLPIAFDTRTNDVESLRLQARNMVERHSMDILFVDYLQLMKSSKNATRAEEVSAVSRGLKEIAMENNIPVVALCQFNRGGAQASIFDLMAYLKESSGIEQDASTILYVQVEKTEEVKQVKDGKITILKNRNGATFQSVEMAYRGEIFQFYEKSI